MRRRCRSKHIRFIAPRGCIGDRVGMGNRIVFRRRFSIRNRIVFRFGSGEPVSNCHSTVSGARQRRCKLNTTADIQVGIEANHGRPAWMMTRVNGSEWSIGKPTRLIQSNHARCRWAATLVMAMASDSCRQTGAHYESRTISPDSHRLHPTSDQGSDRFPCVLD